jgi:hypothetical protein
MTAGDVGSPKRYYSAVAVETSLISSVPAASAGSSTTSVVVASISGFPTTLPFTLILDPDTTKEEVVTVTAQTGSPATTLTIVRGEDGTAAGAGIAHSAGSVVRHGVSAREFKQLQTHISARGYDSDSSIMSGVDTHIHGIATGEGVVVGTDKTQTLTAKTLTSPTINAATITGTVTSTATITGGTMNPTTLTQNSVPVITTTSTSTLTNKTLTSPTINGGTVSSATVTSATIVSGTLSTDLAAGSNKITGLATPTSTADAATKGYVDTSISNLVASAPAALDTLNELAAALGNDAAFSTTVTNNLATKLPKAGGTMTGAIDMGSNKITSLGTPTASTDAVTKGYIDTLYGSTVAAATSATSAAASASAAATSATSAAASATAAATSASSAATSATNAATSASSSLTSQLAAATSATSAEASATAAATSATSAAASATAAATSATSASNYANAAQTSATSAAASQSAAATSATSASISQVAAATSATSAAASATAAYTSATSAATSATSSATTYNTYKTWYLGSFASAPTLDNQGNPLINGATYFNSSASTMYVYNGSTWSAISSATSYSAPVLGSTTINSGTTYTTITGLNLTNGTVTADPTTNLGIASKQYVDGVAAGLNTHDSVQAATTANITGTYTAGSAGADGGTGVGAYFTVTATGVLIIDGYTTVLNDRLLIKDQITPTQNGIYKVTTAGATGVSAVLTRATDYDNSVSGEVYAGDIVFIIGGTKNINQGWVMNATGTSTTPVKGIKVDTDNINWTQFTGASLVTAGNGLSKSGDTLSIDTSITVDKTTAQTLTNKTLTSPVIGTGATFNGATTGTTVLAASATASGTLSLPAATDTLVGKATTDTLTNKTISSGTLTGSLTAASTSGTNGQYLQTTGTGVQWAAATDTTKVALSTYAATGSILVASAASTPANLAIATTSGYVLTSNGTTAAWAAPAATYTAPTLGTTVVTSGTTISTIAGLTKITAAQHTQLDANSAEQDIALMNVMGAW